MVGCRHWQIWKGVQRSIWKKTHEIEMFSKLPRLQLVSLIGYCHEANEVVLVYEFMASGPLSKHLYGGQTFQCCHRNKGLKYALELLKVCITFIQELLILSSIDV